MLKKVMNGAWLFMCIELIWANTHTKGEPKMELTVDQAKTIELSFKSEYLKDEIKLMKEFDDYDFDFEGDE